MLRSKGLCFVLLLLLVAGVYLLNANSIVAHDALSYAFWGQHTPMEGEVPRVASLMDIVRQQWHEYVAPGGTNGRVLVHGLVAFFMGFRLYHLFDLLNTGMWFLLTFLVLREGGVTLKGKSPWIWLLGASIVWWFLWFAETCSMNAAFAVNYLWVAVATLGMMTLWRHLTSWWWVPMAFLYGWTQEAFVLPMLGALALSVLIRSVVEHRLALTSRQAVAWLLMLAGACVLCLGPAALGRAGNQLDLTTILQSLLQVHLRVVLVGSPVVLLCALLWMLWSRRHALGPMVMRSLEWWCYLVAAYGFFCLTASVGIIRLSMPLLMAGVILLLRERAVFRGVSQKVRVGVVALVFVWFGIAVVLQTMMGHHERRMLRLYAQDPQGVTMCPSFTTGPFFFSVHVREHSLWHYMLFRREIGHTCNPTILTPWLYETLYQHPEAFFAEAQPLDDTLFVTPHAPRLVVQKGDAPLTPAQEARLTHYFASQAQPLGWQRLLPGRLHKMFPSEDFALFLPSTRLSLTTPTGHRYTLHVETVE